MARPKRRSWGAAIAIALVFAGASPAAGGEGTTVALWRMNRPRLMVDASGYGNDGDTRAIDVIQPGFDGTRSAYVFNGENSQVVVPDDASLDPGDADISITLHVKMPPLPEGETYDYDLIRKKEPGSLYKVEVLPDGRPLCTFVGSLGRTSISIRRMLANDEWRTVTCTKTASTVSIAVDGGDRSRDVTIGSISNSADVILGGKAGRRGDWYLGLMDDVSIVVG